VNEVALSLRTCDRIIQKNVFDLFTAIYRLLQYTLPLAVKRSSREELEAFHTITVKFFVDRKPHSRRNLQNVKSPIHLVHCGADIAYEIGDVEELRDALEGAGLDVRISQVEGAPHFGCVTHPEKYVCPPFPARIFC
jgi:pimeloyl-ACP methyl ester carboxylesterase